MPRTCTICKHEKCNEINEALLAGESFRHIAARFGISSSALVRHKSKDISTTLAKAKRAREEVKAETLFDRLRQLNRETMAILQEARGFSSRDNELALKAIARAEKQLELEARLLGELNDTAKVAVGINVNPPPFDPGREVLSDEMLANLIALGNQIKEEEERSKRTKMLNPGEK